MENAALLFLGTAAFVASSLGTQPTLEWSLPIVGLFKALELEVVARLLAPWRAACRGLDLSTDMADKDFGRVARYCAGEIEVPPELGTVAYTLQAIASSKRRAEHSELVRGLRDRASAWQGGEWLLTTTGLAADLQLTRSYRNRAAHIDELGREDFELCWEHIAGEHGTLWKLIDATL